MVVQHKILKNRPAEIERVFVGKDYEDSLYITFSYTGEFKRANRWTGVKVNGNEISPKDLRHHYRVSESYYRIVTKSCTISFIDGKQELFRTLEDLGYNLPKL